MAITNTVSSVTSIVRTLINDHKKTDGRNVFTYDDDNSFTLSKDFVDSSTIKVFQNNSEIDSVDFSYDSSTNRVTITFVTSGKSLTKGDTITITFSYFQKYSDTEIKNYIQGSFYYFVKHRYFKEFEIDSNDNIISINHVNPTNKELFFMAGITSILIDSQNTSIRTADFTVDSRRDKSDQEQIADAFKHFERFVGSIEFIED